MPSKLGQHFLKNRGAIKKIVSALNLKNGETVIEIGPGHGALTGELRIQNYELRIIGIEKDKSLALSLKKKYAADANIEIINGDALKILPKLFTNCHLPFTNYKLVGNIPYYITGRLLRILSEMENKPQLLVLTLQKEVAERIAAKPPQMNLLSAITQFWAEPKIIARLKPNDFSPPPKVESAIIKLATRVQPLATSIKSQAIYYKFLKIIFKQPRKTILNNLRAGLKISPEELLKALKNHSLTGAERPQDLNLETLIKLSVFLKDNML